MHGTIEENVNTKEEEIMMKILDNISENARDDMAATISKSSKVSIAAACFSMYAYKELKKQLESVDEFRFIFTSPTFIKERESKEKREFYIPRMNRENSLYGTEFEIKLRNELTQKAVAKECAEWIRKKAIFKSNVTGENMAGFMTVDTKKTISLRPNLTSLKEAINYNEIYEQLMLLSLCIYTPSNYIFASKMEKYMDLTHNKGQNLTQKGREQGIRRLMSINLLKRLESSVYSFYLTLSRIKSLITDTLEAIDYFEEHGNADIDMYEANESEFDMDDGNTEFFQVGKKVKINLADMDYQSWRKELKVDLEVLELLTLMVADITPEYDTKLQTLYNLISDKLEHPINEGNRKILIFSAFSDTAEYLYENVSVFVKENYGLDTAMMTGAVDGKTTIQGLKATLNNVLTCFSPISKSKSVLMPDNNFKIDVLIATDCISEGQPLSMPYTSEVIDGCTVHTYNDGDLIACFDDNIPDSVVKTIAKRQPLRAVFRDSSFANSPSKINVGEVFKLLAPDTRVKVI